ncbi:prolyl oligopeptidase family serine peptidase [Acetobacter fabarum]|uniref:prolyl oligopeptidase family serine peptidase n=1 Tax=Acetobacter fabarum TaxID=483199 RepID=UPI0038D1C1CC
MEQNSAHAQVPQPMRCGSWPSPVTATLVAGKSLTFSEVRSAGQAVFWLERRPAEGGRTVLMRWAEPDGVAEVLPAQADVGTRVHEYGGGAYALASCGVAYVDRRTAQVWLLVQGEVSPRLLAGAEGVRFADLRFDPASSTVVAVREDHRVDGEPQGALVALGGAAGPVGLVLQCGADFYMSPTLSPDGALLAWIEWDHPNMPWDSTRLCMGRVVRGADGTIAALEGVRVLAGQAGGESLVEPRWTADGRLLVISDRAELWRVWEVVHQPAPHLVAYAMPEGEIGQPAWVFGQSSYQPLADGGCVALSVRDGEGQCFVRTANDQTHLFAGRPDQCPVMLADGQFAWVQAPVDALPAVVVGTAEQGVRQVLRRSAMLDLPVADISRPESVRFTVDGPPGPQGHAFFYPPASSHACVPQNEKPPMIVLVHGGPTARAQDGFSFKVQWWTSRGFAVLDVNYGGSTGFGRFWRNRLQGQWGVVDVADCIAACRHMVATGRVDPKRIAIRGSSAGGMTVLLALAASDLFAAGVSLYGVTDLRALAQETHKFEARYLDGLVGPWPESEAVYVARSPLSVASRIRAPVLLLQGMEDKVVPPSQAHAMAAALRTAGTPCTLHEFPGEGHGFRQEATIRQAWTMELAFYGRVFGFDPAPPMDA